MLQSHVPFLQSTSGLTRQACGSGEAVKLIVGTLLQLPLLPSKPMSAVAMCSVRELPGVASMSTGVWERVCVAVWGCRGHHDDGCFRSGLEADPGLSWPSAVLEGLLPSNVSRAALCERDSLRAAVLSTEQCRNAEQGTR